MSAPAGRPSTTPEVGYPQARAKIQTGDVLLFQGTHWLSRLIRRFSRSAYSHAGIAIWWNERLMVVQSASRGVEVLPASTAVDRYDGQVDWWQPSEYLRSRVDVAALVNASFDELGKPFAVMPLLALGARIFRGKDEGNTDGQNADPSYFCSQFVSRCYRKAGFDLVPNRSDADTSPGDLARCNQLLIRGVLRAHPTGVVVHLPVAPEALRAQSTATLR